MKNITELTITRYRTSFEKDSSGKRTKIRTPYTAKREVKIASAGKRFAHLFLDMMVFVFPIQIIQIFVFMSNNDPFDREYQTINYILGLLFYVVYFGGYFCAEYFFGITLGKLVTGSVVINKYAEKPTVKEAIVRTIVRIVPFEPITFLFGRGWHDRWSETWVVSKKEKLKLHELLHRENNL